MKKTLLPIMMLSFFLLACLHNVQAQKKKKYLHDSNYYELYPDKITGRLYMGQKFTQFKVPSGSTIEDLQYRANRKLNIGIGVTWHNYTLNVGYGFSGINKDSKIKGKTKGLDLQFHLYPHKWAIDLLAIMPKGMYLHPKGYAAANPASYYYRPDVKERLFEVAVYRVPNMEKFSYRAAIVQNEWQKKSAGSPLYGGQIDYVIAEGDSAIVPVKIQNGFPQAGVTEFRFISFGPGIGYAYTAVLNQHFFIMGSLIGNLKINLTTEEIGPTVANKKTSIAPSAIYKAAIGYNSSTWSFAANITGNALLAKGASSTKNYFFPAGAWRVSLAKKIDLKHHHG